MHTDKHTLIWGPADGPFMNLCLNPMFFVAFFSPPFVFSDKNKTRLHSLIKVKKKKDPKTQKFIIAKGVNNYQSPLILCSSQKSSGVLSPRVTPMINTLYPTCQKISIASNQHSGYAPSLMITILLCLQMGDFRWRRLVSKHAGAPEDMPPNPVAQEMPDGTTSL